MRSKSMQGLVATAIGVSVLAAARAATPSLPGDPFTDGQVAIASPAIHEVAGPKFPTGPVMPVTGTESAAADAGQVTGMVADTQPVGAPQPGGEQQEDPHADAAPAPAPEPKPEPEPAVPSFSSKHSLFDYSAHDDGSMNEWAPGWYNTHEWSESGQTLHALWPGDSIIVDGMEIRIVAREYISDSESYESIRGRLGPDVVIFQTCAGMGQNLIVSGVCDGYEPFATISSHDLDGRAAAEKAAHSQFVNDFGSFATLEEAEAACEAYARQQAEASESTLSGTLSSTIG